MARVCDTCKKKNDSGNRRSHSVRATRCVRKANLQVFRITVNGTKLKLKICNPCRKTFNKAA